MASPYSFADIIFESPPKVLVFFKARPDVVTPENLDRDVLVSSMMDSPVSALYHALHNVYAPLLLKDAKWSTEFDPKLQVRKTSSGLKVTRRRGWTKTVGQLPFRPFLIIVPLGQ